jgi:hypothetical protein
MKNLTLLCASLFLASCVTGGSDEGRNRNLTVVGRLRQFCPLTVTCDENYDYHAYAGDIDSLSLYLSFKPGIVKDKSGAGVLAAFDYMYFTLSFPSLKTDSSTVYVSSHALFGRVNDSTLFKHEIIKYENGKLYGRIAFPVQQLTERVVSRSPDCIAGDELGLCYKTRDLKNRIDYVIDYEVELVE